MTWRFSRRAFLVLGIGTPAGLLLVSDAGEADTGGSTAPRVGSRPTVWWRRLPTMIQGDDALQLASSGASVNMIGAASDPTWGPYGQRLSALDGRQHKAAAKQEGARLITWIEGFGDCMLYAVSVTKTADGKYVRRTDDPNVTQVDRSHWSWSNRTIRQGNSLRWVGIHNLVNDEEFARFPRSGPPVPAPTYPDGRTAAGWLPDGPYPLNARVYDACGAKDLYGSLHPAFETPAGVNEIDPATGQRRGPEAGLLPAILGKDDVGGPAGMKPGDTVYAGVVSVHKDLSAPFWREYARASVHEIVRQGLDGVWCDNYSPWDNFGYPPLQKAFGDWSVNRFHDSMAKSPHTAPAETRSPHFDVREYLKQKAKSFGASQGSHYDDPSWRDRRWLDDPVWNAFKAFRQRAGQQDLRLFYEAIHEAAAGAGRPDFCIGGNDIPVYGLGWVRDAWLDMVNTEVNPGWHMGTGSRGIMTPPLGKMAVVYRAALEHQKAPFAVAWYYLNGPHAPMQQKSGIAKVLITEAFANGTFLLCYPSNKEMAGSVADHRWWNEFTTKNHEVFENRAPLADVGILFSPDNQLTEMAPGGFVDMDRQPHIFGHYGWATALIDSHIPYRALPDWKLTDRELSGLKTLVLPDAACVADEAVGPILRWVRAGGRLVLSGDAGVRHGPERQFARREQSVFAGIPGGIRHEGTTPLGRGVVRSTPDSPGMSYYLESAGRAALRPQIMALTGQTALVDGASLRSTVGLFLWRSHDGKSLFVDLVNYAVDAEGDEVQPARDLVFRLRIPSGWRSVEVKSLSPDPVSPVTASFVEGHAMVRVPRLDYFISVQLTGPLAAGNPKNGSGSGDGGR